MAGKPQTPPMQTDSDPARPHLGEPDHTERMSLVDNNGSITVTIPFAAAKILGYEVGEERVVEVYQDGVFIPREAADE